MGEWEAALSHDDSVASFCRLLDAKTAFDLSRGTQGRPRRVRL